MLSLLSLLRDAVAGASTALAPWASLYANSLVVSTGMAFLHLAGVLVGGGLALASDRATLRAATADRSERGRLLEQLHAVHRPVLAALAVTFATGVLMLAADLETFARSPALWAKLAIVVLLLANGLRLRRTETGLRAAAADDAAAWRRLRATALASIALWLAALLAGTVLQVA